MIGRVLEFKRKSGIICSQQILRNNAAYLKSTYHSMYKAKMLKDIEKSDWERFITNVNGHFTSQIKASKKTFGNKTYKVEKKWAYFISNLERAYATKKDHRVRDTFYYMNFV